MRSALPSEAPDYCDPFVGWRVWIATEDDGAIRLRSVVFNVAWPVREPMIANCLRRRMNLLPWRRQQSHDAPGFECDCGVYASSLERIAGYLDDRFDGKRVHRVVGRVSLWGSVVECSWGWRASHAYPEKIYVPCWRRSGRDGLSPAEVALGLVDYGVPVDLLDGTSPERAIDELAATVAG